MTILSGDEYMNEFEFDTNEEMDKTQDIEATIEALKVMDKLSVELTKLEKDSIVYQKRLRKLLREKKGVKKMIAYTGAVVLIYAIAITMLLALVKHTGDAYLDFMPIIGIGLLGVGFIVGIVGVVFSVKQRGREKEKAIQLNQNIVEVQLKLDVIQADVQALRERDERVSQMAKDILEKYGHCDEKETYMEKLLELKGEIERYNDCKIRHE